MRDQADGAGNMCKYILPIPTDESEKQRKQWILKKESGQEGQQKWIDPNKDSYFLLTLDLPVEGKRR